jgi:hypothetical protein
LIDKKKGFNHREIESGDWWEADRPFCILSAALQDISAEQILATAKG